MVDVEAKDFLDLCTQMGGSLTNSGLDPEGATQLVELWQAKHRHQFEGPRKAEGKLTSVIKELLVQKLESKAERLDKILILIPNWERKVLIKRIF